MDRKTEHIARLRAGGFCEYCRLPEAVSHLPFSLDHIVARQHGGTSTEENLAVACPWCNRHKGPNLSSIDPEDGSVVSLYHPRRDRWADHFRLEGGQILGRTSAGRATVRCLAMNDANVVSLRRALIAGGVFPRDPQDPAGEGA